MIKSKKTCSIEGCNFPVFARNCCKRHDPKPKKGLKKVSDSQRLKNQVDAIDTKLLREHMKSWWEKQSPNKCWACGCSLPSEFHTYMVDHLLMKSIYKEFARDEDNFYLCCLSCHSSKECGYPKEHHKQAIENFKKNHNL